LALESFEGILTGRRGRPAIPDCWTRVIAGIHKKREEFKMFKLNSELILQSALPRETWHIEEGSWKPLFYPKKQA